MFETPIVSELMALCPTDIDQTEMAPQFQVSSERPEKQGIEPPSPGLVVQCVNYYTDATPDIPLTLLLSERSKLHRVLTVLSAVGLNKH